MKLKKLICLIKAIPFYLKTGEWVPHHYGVSEYKKVIIIADEKSFRVSDSYEHSDGENVYRNACLITDTCKHCGHKEVSWYRSWEERWRLDRKTG